MVLVISANNDKSWSFENLSAPVKIGTLWPRKLLIYDLPTFLETDLLRIQINDVISIKLDMKSLTLYLDIR